MVFHPSLSAEMVRVQMADREADARARRGLPRRRSRWVRQGHRGGD